MSVAKPPRSARAFVLAVLCLLLLAAAPDSYNPRDYGAKGDGKADDTGPITAAWAASGNVGPLVFGAGVYSYNGTGLTCPAGRVMTITGMGREASRVVLGPSSRLIDTPGYLNGLLLSDLGTVGGLGAFRSTLAGPNSGSGQVTIARCKFSGYTECAISANATDFPFWRITDCDFYGTDGASIGVALSGWTDGGSIAGCNFGLNRIHLKLRGAGPNLTVDRCTFTPFEAPPAGSPPRVAVWMAPSPIANNGGNNCLLRACRFGNEGLQPADYRIVYADEDQTGADNATRFPLLTTPSSGWVVGHRYESCSLYGSNDAPQPWVYSTTPHVVGCTFGPLFAAGTRPSYFLQFLSPPGPSPAAPCVFGPLTSDTVGVDQKSMGTSNAVGFGVKLDPLGLIDDGVQTPSVPTPIALAPWRTSGACTAAPTVVGTGATGDAWLLHLDPAAGGIVWAPLAAANVQVGAQAWLVFEVKSAAPSSVTLQLASDGLGVIHWRRQIATSPGWSRHAFPWVPMAAPTTLNLVVSAPTTRDVYLGRMSIRHAAGPITTP